MLKSAVNFWSRLMCWLLVCVLAMSVLISCTPRPDNDDDGDPNPIVTPPDDDEDDDDDDDDPVIIPPKTPAQQFRSDYMTHVAEIPVVRITTAGPIVDRTNYVSGTFAITGSTSNNLSPQAMGIRGRGNSSWEEHDKKSYRVKFDKKTSIFGYDAVKNWALIANHADKTFMRNYLTYMLGRSLDSQDFAPNLIFVELYINDDYLGLYALTDQIEAKPSRVDVEVSDTSVITNASGEVVDCGFLVELDFRAVLDGNVLGRDYFRIDSITSGSEHGAQQMYVIKYPQYDDDGFADNPALYNKVHNYIRKYLTDTYAAIVSRNMTKFDSMCDRASFVDFFIVQELAKNVDAHKGSVFFHKKLGQPMEMGPLWDFDISFGNCDFIPSSLDWTQWYVVNMSGWMRELMKNSAFYEDFRTRYMQLYQTNIQYTIDSIDYIRLYLSAAAGRNFQRWNILGTRVWPNPSAVVNANTYVAQVAYLKDFWTRRSDFLFTQLRDRALSL